MKKLCVILVFDNVIRSTLRELPELTDATYWLVATQRYMHRLSAEHSAIFERVLRQDAFTVPALIARLDAELASAQPAEVVFLTNDESCEIACVALQQRFGGRGWSLDRVLPCVNKLDSKRGLAGSGVRLPRYLRFEKDRFGVEAAAYSRELVAAIGLPMIAKPVDRYASMHVTRLDSLDELMGWAAATCSRGDSICYEVEEFVDGTLYHCDSLVRDGTVLWTNVCRNINPCLDFAAGRSIGAYTIPADHPDAAAVRELNARVLTALRPPDGAVHLECFIRPPGETVFLELSARPPGGDVTGLYRRCFGFDIDVAHFALRAREPYRLQARSTGWFGGWAIHPKRTGRLGAVRLPALRSEHRYRLSVIAGETIDGASRHIMDEPAAEFWFFSEDFFTMEHDARLLGEMGLCWEDA
jgi:biotin carboxylase